MKLFYSKIFNSLILIFVLLVGLRQAFGLNRGLFGPKSNMFPMSEGKMWDTGNVSKSSNQTLGWSPGITGSVYTRFQCVTEALYLVSGFLVQICTSRPCSPKEASFVVRKGPWMPSGYYNYGSAVRVWYSSNSEVSTINCKPVPVRQH